MGQSGSDHPMRLDAGGLSAVVACRGSGHGDYFTSPPCRTITTGVPAFNVSITVGDCHGRLCEVWTGREPRYGQRCRGPDVASSLPEGARGGAATGPLSPSRRDRAPCGGTGCSPPDAGECKSPPVRLVVLTRAEAPVHMRSHALLPASDRRRDSLGRAEPEVVSDGRGKRRGHLAPFGNPLQ